MSTMRVAVVGAGPSGFYASAALLASEDPVVAVDLYDRLPTPFGLVRAGVAPDHPKIKAVTAQYAKVAEHERFRFFGHVDVGAEVSRADLLARYHAVLWSVGTAQDRRLGIPGEHLRGSHAATDFVAWYNGHPDYGTLEFELAGAERVAVIGNGNVAIDVARMIALTPDELQVTDVADHAIGVLSGASVEEVVVIGRRGPAQAAFTSPELLEMGELERAEVVVDPAEVELDAASAAWLDDQSRTPKRNVEILTAYAHRRPTGKPVRVVFRFLRSPIALIGDGRVQAIRLERNELVARDDDGSLSARGTGETEDLAVDLVFRSIGYTGLPLPGVPFDERRGLIRNVDGRVTDEDGTPIAGEYAAGWVKRGPSGVIGTNKKCAKDTVALLLEDARARRLNDPPRDDIGVMVAELAPHAVSWRGWEAIDAAERAAGEARRRPRVKIATWDELRSVGVG